MTEVAYKLPSGVSLKEAERVIWYDRRSLASYLTAFILVFLFLLISIVFVPFIVIPILLLLGIFLHRFSHEYALTNERAISKRGIVGRKLREAPLKNVTDTAFDQGIFGRMFNYGTVRLNTAGTGGYEVNWIATKNPAHARERVASALEVHKVEAEKRTRLQRFEDRLLTGEITQEQYETAKEKIAGG